jgi:hypothetical protein
MALFPQVNLFFLFEPGENEFLASLYDMAKKKFVYLAEESFIVSFCSTKEKRTGISWHDQSDKLFGCFLSCLRVLTD